MIVSLVLCTHWVMACLVTNHYTAKASYVLDVSIWGLGILFTRQLLADIC